VHNGLSISHTRHLSGGYGASASQPTITIYTDSDKIVTRACVPFALQLSVEFGVSERISETGDATYVGYKQLAGRMTLLIRIL
jgi:hypothetical protein